MGTWTQTPELALKEDKGTLLSDCRIDVSKSRNGYDNQDVASEFFGTVSHAIIDRVDTTSTVVTDASQLAALAVAADAKDAEAFLIIWRGIDWIHQPPHVLIDAIRLALAMDASHFARQLSNLARSLHPDNVEIMKAARVLAQPVIRTPNYTDLPDRQAAYLWLEQHGSDHKGKWVAIRAGELVAAADSMAVIVDQLGDIRNTDIFLTRVW